MDPEGLSRFFSDVHLDTHLRSLLTMLPTLVVRSRSAWKGKCSADPGLLSILTRLSPGPFFVAFPNLADAHRNNTAIRTNARSCTILPNFVG